MQRPYPSWLPLHAGSGAAFPSNADLQQLSSAANPQPMSLDPFTMEGMLNNAAVLQQQQQQQQQAPGFSLTADQIALMPLQLHPDNQCHPTQLYQPQQQQQQQHPSAWSSTEGVPVPSQVPSQQQQQQQQQQQKPPAWSNSTEGVLVPSQRQQQQQQQQQQGVVAPSSSRPAHYRAKLASFAGPTTAAPAAPASKARVITDADLPVPEPVSAAAPRPPKHPPPPPSTQPPCPPPPPSVLQKPKQLLSNPLYCSDGPPAPPLQPLIEEDEEGNEFDEGDALLLHLQQFYSSQANEPEDKENVAPDGTVQTHDPAFIDDALEMVTIMDEASSPDPCLLSPVPFPIISLVYVADGTTVIIVSAANEFMAADDAYFYLCRSLRIGLRPCTTASSSVWPRRSSTTGSAPTA